MRCKCAATISTLPHVVGIGCVPALQRAFAANNFVRFFALVRQAPYLLACLSHIYFGQVRSMRCCGELCCRSQECMTRMFRRRQYQEWNGQAVLKSISNNRHL